MIAGIGADIIEIERFAHWVDYPREKLDKIFSNHEIDYCLANRTLSAQRFAVRFAAKEALYKALSAAGMEPKFFILCRESELFLEARLPRFKVNWTALGIPSFRAHVGLSHNKTMAQAVVVLENI